MMTRKAIHPWKIAAAVGAAFLLWGLVLAYASSPSWAAEITVNNTADPGTDDAQCTLREAITSANTDTAFGGCLTGSGEDVINIEATGTVDLTAALPDLSTNLAIAGPGADEVTVGRDTGGTYGIFNVTGGSVVSISGITISNGNASNGGGISNNEGGTLTVAGSTVSDNSAEIGGGINNRGTLTVTGSTISGNSASLASVGGGGVFTDTSPSGNPFGDTTTITNSTISGNTTDGFGGGVYNEDGRTVIEHSTITDNTAPNGQGSGVASFGDSFTPTEVLSTIVAANTNTDVDFVRGTTNSFDSNGYNLIGSGNATGALNETTDETGVSDPGLDPLDSYGGPTQTHRLQPDSLALDAGPPTDGDPTSCPPPSTDQRGVERPQDGDADSTPTCDIGSFELEVPENRAPTVAVDGGGKCGAVSDSRGTINLALSDPDTRPQDLDLSASSSDRSVVPNGAISFGGGTDESRTLTVKRLAGTGASFLTLTLSDGDLQDTLRVRVRSGSAANNALTGSPLSDMIFARKGIDTASGGASNDLLCGGNGRDELTGGAGADHFGGGANTDRAEDFDASEGDTRAGIP